MRKHYIELSIYNIVNREYPRVVIMDTDENDMGGGTRLYGNKFSVSSSVKTFRIPLTIKLIDDFIDELNVTKNKILEEENGGLKDKLAKPQCGSCDRKGGCDEPEKHDALIVGINKIMASANEEQKDAKTYDEMSFQSGIIASCIDLKYQIEHGVWKKVPNLKEHIQYEYGSYKEMAEKADRENSWKRYYRGKANVYKMIAELLSEEDLERKKKTNEQTKTH